MIYITGDTHGALEIDKVVNFFNKPAQKKCNLTKMDYLIVLGDIGVCWDNGRNDKYVRTTLKELPVTTLFIDGNHENFDMLNEYDVTFWNGGMVHEIEPDILHLIRGQVFKIEGRTFFTFGGAFSTDKSYRTEGIDWWPEELPSEDEYERGVKALESVKNKVDFVLTHTAPYDVVAELGVDMHEEEEELQQYLQNIADTIHFKHWLFGHFHEDIKIEDRFYCVMEKVLTVNKNKN